MSSAFTPTSPLRQRFRPLAWLAITFLSISFVTRVVLLVMSGHEVAHTPLNLLYAFGVGLGYDLVTFIYVAWPLVLFLWLVPTRSGALSPLLRWLVYAFGVALACVLCVGALHLKYHASLKVTWPAILPFLFVLPLAAFTYTSRVGQWVLYGFGLLLLYGLLFVAASELVFWNEFSVRFNFIAVDYLVYTTEVIGNIQESYPIGKWLALLVLLALVVFAVGKRGLRARDDGSRLWQRGKVVVLWLVLTIISVAAVNGGMKDRTHNNYVNELAGNGIYQFFAAFRSSHLDYAKFYRTLPDDQAYARLRQLLKTPDATFIGSDPRDLTREIRHIGPEKRLNVVLISVESLSGDYLGTFGNKEHLTPYLDSLVDQSVFFDNLYANGTRTVRGLEALALSVPPTPGDSLIREQHNEKLFSLADIFNDRGYQSDFVYGGYGQFDNMNYFFANNGYRAVDRRDIPKTATIHGENVWGVADEDLYTLALGQMDQIHAEGRPFFLHIMTTSNHRPYTFPDNRVKFSQPHAGRRSGLYRLVDRRFHPPRTRKAVFRQHGVRDHRRPLRIQRRQDQPADQSVSHPAVDLFAGELQARTGGAADGPAGHPADPAGHAQLQLPHALLRPRPVPAAARARTCVPRHLREARLSAERRPQHPRTAAQAGAVQARLRYR